MPNAVPIKGVNAKVTVAPITGGTVGTAVTLKNSKWDFSKDPNISTAPNTTDGMLRAAGLLDYEITISGSLDNTTGSQIEANIAEGADVQICLYRDTSHFWTLTSSIITKFSESTGAEELDEWSFSAAKNGGTITAPTYT
jgi:hypothetical protein